MKSRRSWRQNECARLLIFLMFVFCCSQSVAQASNVCRSTSGFNDSGLEALHEQTSRITSISRVGPDSECTRWQEFIKANRVTSSNDLVSATLQTLPDDASIAVVGTVHGSEASPERETLLKLFSGLTEDSHHFDCLLIEAPSDLQEDLDALAQGEAGLRAFVEKQNRKLYAERFNTSLTSVDIQTRTWNLLSQLAKSRGLRLYSIDESLTEKKKHGAASTLGMSDRNPIMANRISELHSSGACKRSIVLTGWGHLTENQTQPPIVPIPVLLDQKGLKHFDMIVMEAPPVLSGELFDVAPKGCSLEPSLAKTPTLLRGATWSPEACSAVRDSKNAGQDCRFRPPFNPGQAKLWLLY